MKVNANVREKEPKDNIELLKEWRDKNVQRYELVENYYSMVFTGIGNKNQPFDFRMLTLSLIIMNSKTKPKKVFSF